MAALELTRLLSEEMNVSLPETLLFDRPTIQDISGVITNSLNADEGKPSTSSIQSSAFMEKPESSTVCF